MTRVGRLAGLSLPLSIFIGAGGCGSRLAYSPPVPQTPEGPRVLNASFDQTWNGVIQTFFDRNIPVKTLEKASGLLESEELRGEIGRDCDCGSWLGVPIAGYGAYGGDAYYRYRVLVERRSERESALTLRATCRARTERVEGDLVCELDPAKQTELRDAITTRATSAAPKGS